MKEEGGSVPSGVGAECILANCWKAQRRNFISPSHEQPATRRPPSSLLPGAEHTCHECQTIIDFKVVCVGGASGFEGRSALEEQCKGGTCD
jgi:hypothetical protein